MILEWIRFALTAVLLIGALVCFALAVFGVYRFRFVMNDIHSAGIGDTLGLFGVAAALIISSGLSFDALKAALLVMFLWFTSPVSSHFLGQVEFFTNPRLGDEVELPQDEESGKDAPATPRDEESGGDVPAMPRDADAGGDVPARSARHGE